MTLANLKFIMSDEVKIIEIGASTILDFMKTKSWTKLFNNHAPKWGVPLDYRDYKKLRSNYDIIFISMGSKDREGQTLDRFITSPNDSNIWNSCVFKPYKILSHLLKDSIKSTLIVYLDSISTLNYVPYPSSIDYSISKSAMGIYLKNLAYLNDRVKVMDFHIGSTKTRMCSHGMDPEDVFDEIIWRVKDAYEYFDRQSRYESIIIDLEGQINELKIN